MRKIKLRRFKTAVKKQKNSPVITGWYVASQVGQIGVIIALPLVGFLSLGVWLDKFFETKVFFTLVGTMIALAVSSFSIAEKIKKISRK